LKTIWTLLRKDMLRRARSPSGVLLLMAIPLVISMIFGTVFSPSGEQKLPRLKLLIVDSDGSFVSQFIKAAFTQGELAEMIELQEVGAEDGREMMDRGKATALLEIPEGFGDAVLDGRVTSLRLVKNPAGQFLPDIAEKIVDTLALLLDYAARILADPIREFRASQPGDTFPTLDKWNSVGSMIYASIAKLQKYVLPPVIQIETEIIKDEEEEAGDMNLFGLFLPGIALMSLLFIAEIAFRDLAVEHRGGQLRRIFVTPTGPLAIILGKLAYAFALVYMSFLVMTVSGILIFGMTLENHALFFLGGALSSLACTGLMGAVYSFVGQERKGEAVSSIFIIVMCLIGGSFVPPQALPDFLNRAARFTLNHWSIDLLQGSISSGFTSGNALTDILVLSGITFVTVSLSVLVLKRKMFGGFAA